MIEIPCQIRDFAPSKRNEDCIVPSCVLIFVIIICLQLSSTKHFVFAFIATMEMGDVKVRIYSFLYQIKTDMNNSKFLAHKEDLKPAEL